MKNFLLLILTAIVFSGCGSQDQQKKQELKHEIYKLELHKKQLLEQKSGLKEQLEKAGIDYERVVKKQNATDADRRIAQERLVTNIHQIKSREMKLEKQLIETELKIQKLELESAKLERKSKSGTDG
ncbi:hypothetical protein [Fluviicola sp.]|uniref:hypothetical protein n=1 Tax=Fluviicola sp. TaxID=1917219 RepID=UPI0031D81FD1